MLGGRGDETRGAESGPARNAASSAGIADEHTIWHGVRVPPAAQGLSRDCGDGVSVTRASSGLGPLRDDEIARCR